ncbi:hypothetical protein [Nitrosospira sp. Nl5]|uniref:hypothetical protein n=1 Tax=Nitrosospira sp. Nl5 TaxID=200120 RepID=UPI00115FB843|nr:hypothetical protein [Nitrosospira sp. Nl5]
MNIRIKNVDTNPHDAVLQSAESTGSFDLNPAGILRALTDFYESNPAPDEAESEVDLMIQLSGMVYNSMQNEE